MKESNKTNALISKSFEFAIDIVNLARYLQAEKNEYVISKQVLRSGTSIGANSEESQGAESLLDFIHKLKIARKEARETHYWLRILKETGYIKKEEIINKSDELIRLLTSIILTNEKKGNS